MLEVADVLRFGAAKYSDANWRKGRLWSKDLGAALRHIFLWMSGEDRDPESGCNHLAHAVCDLLFLLEFQRFSIGTDDRPKGES